MMIKNLEQTQSGYKTSAKMVKTNGETVLSTNAIAVI
jgi:hypothetical protein